MEAKSNIPVHTIIHVKYGRSLTRANALLTYYNVGHRSETKLCVNPANGDSIACRAAHPYH